MKADLFKSIVARIVGPTLSEIGYEVDLNPPGYDFEGEVWFEKTLQEGIYVMIDFQPLEPELNILFEFAINLARNDYSCEVYRKKQTLPGYFLYERLGPWLWIKDRRDPEWRHDHWWHFIDEDALEGACLDALDKLLKYGIPYLEDLSSESPKLYLSQQS
jgi:hypothetical protein